MRPTLLVSLIIACVFLTTMWTAFNLQPMKALIRPAAVSWTPTDDLSLADEPPVQYVRVSEHFLLRQLARAFLAAPWLLPDAGKGRTPREPPPQGWAFPTADDDADDGGEEGEVPSRGEQDEGVMLSDSATAITTQRLQRLGTHSTAPSDTAEPWQNGGAIDDSTQGMAYDELGWGGGSTGDSLETPERAEIATESEDEQDALGADGASDAADLDAELPAQEDQSDLFDGVDDEEDLTGLVTAQRWSRGLVSSLGRQVAIEYRGPSVAVDGETGADGESTPSPRRGPFLSLCGSDSDWLCASARVTTLQSSRFELLALVPSQLYNVTDPLARAATGGSNSSGVLTGVLTGNASLSGGDWFALRSLRNRRLVQVAPTEDDEAWVVRARGQPLEPNSSRSLSVASSSSSSGLLVSGLELWREEGGGLRNLGTGALLNFRGDDEGGEGIAVRAHGDTKPRRAARRPSEKTHFALKRLRAARKRSTSSKPR
jgi:hypothetical protein